MNRLQMRLLIALLHLNEQDAAVTHLASLFGLAKSSISRSAQDLVEQGYVYKNERIIMLTHIGREFALESEARFQRIFQALQQAGIPAEQAVQDSYTLLMAVNPQTADALLSHNPAPYSPDPQRYFHHKADGIYPLPFGIYTTQNKGARKLSMANDAFCHPAQLVMQGGRGVIRLTTTSVTHSSAFHSQMMSGALLNMAYLDGNHYHDCLLEANTVCFPAHSLSLLPVENYSLLIGEVLIKIFPDVDEKHMPVRTALFTAYL